MAASSVPIVTYLAFRATRAGHAHWRRERPRTNRITRPVRDGQDFSGIINYLAWANDNHD